MGDMAAAGVQVNVRPELRRKKELADEVHSAIETDRYFYVGAAAVAKGRPHDGAGTEAVKHGFKSSAFKYDSAMGTLYESEGQPDRPKGFWLKPKHHNDSKARYIDLKLVKIFCTRSVKAETANELYRALRGAHLQDRLCVNDNHTTDQIPETENLKGIVYVRIYEHNRQLKHRKRKCSSCAKANLE